MSKSVLALMILALGPLAAGQHVPEEAEILNVPGTDTVVATWIAEERPWYAVDLDGDGWDVVKETSYELLMRHGEFDPLRDVPPAVPAALANADTTLWIVQYVTQGLEAYREVVRALGGEVVRFLARHANVVVMSPETAAAVARLPFVRWVGPCHPAWRLDPVLLPGLLRGTLPRQRYDIQCVHRGLADMTIVRATAIGLGASVDELVPDGYRLTAELDPDQLAALLRLDQVFWVDRWQPDEEDLNVVRDFSGANYVENNTGYTGQGVRGEVMDGNILTTHEQWNGNAPLAHTALVGSQTHGTPVYGIVFGTGNGNGNARGLLPDAEQGIFADYGQYGGNRYTHTAQLLNPPYNAVFQTNSWGSGLTTSYTNISTEMDDILFINDIVITQSQSNAGSQSSRPQAWAKNIVACGGIRHYNTLTENDDAWNGGASIGPAQDGRLKPDLAHFYDNTTSAYSSSNTSYTSFGGTSGATPIVAGHFGLFFQMWSEGEFGNLPPGSTVFDNKPHATTARAMMINTATSWAFSGSSHDLSRYKQGWGRPDVERLYDLRDKMLIVDETDVLTNLQSTSYNVTVDPGEPELRATLVYLEPMGTTSSSLHRINDLSLKVTSPTGTVYWGNNGLAAGNASTSGGSANTIDPVENVRIPNPLQGSWTVEVIASDVNQDNHTETPQVDVDYALVVSGIVGSNAVPGPTPNPMTFDSPPTQLNTNTAIMTATNATSPVGNNIEYFFELVTATALGGSSSGWVSSPTWADSGLAPSGSYSYTVRARDATTLTETAPSGIETVYMDPAVPGAPSITNVTNGSFDVTGIDVNGNDGFVMFAMSVNGLWLNFATGDLGPTEVWSWEQFIPGAVATNLAPDTVYNVSMKARNFLGVESVLGPATTVTTDLLGPCAAGELGLGQGGPFDVLTVNGSSGAPVRRVSAPVGSPFTFAVSQPPTTAVSASFIVLGWLGVPQQVWEYPLPGAVGTLCFNPCITPSNLPAFNLVSTFGPTVCGEFLQGTSAPWSYGHPGLPFPLLITLQVLIEQSPGVLRTGNAVVFEYQ